MRIEAHSTVVLDRRGDCRTIHAKVVRDVHQVLSEDTARQGWQRARVERTGMEVLVRVTDDLRVVRNWDHRLAYEVEVREIETLVEDRNGTPALVAGEGKWRARGMVRREHVQQ